MIALHHDGPYVNKEAIMSDDEMRKAANRAKMAESMVKVNTNRKRRIGRRAELAAKMGLPPTATAETDGSESQRYGCKGGDSPTAGRKAVNYRVDLPDGSVAIKRSFHVDQPVAHAGIYQHQGFWFVSAVTATEEKWPGQTFVKATRLTAAEAKALRKQQRHA